MKTYTIDDQATFYFIVAEHTTGNQIKGWTDNKTLAEFYMEFHNCKKHRVRVVSKRFKDILQTINENTNDEIVITNLITKSDDKKDNGYKIIQIPATSAEMSVMHDAESTSCSTLVSYSKISDCLTTFKKKYQRAFDNIGLTDVIRQEIYNKSTKFTETLQFDQLRLLFRLFVDDFD